VTRPNILFITSDQQHYSAIGTDNPRIKTPNLDRLSTADNTLVLFGTDHGHFLGQHGLIAKEAFHYEDMLRIAGA
jgi:arylsulfatase A-like enzyme